MITILPSTKPAIFAVEINGKINIEQENEMLKKVNEMLKYHEKVSILAVLGKDANWSVSAGLKDIKWVFNNISKLDKIAIVADSKVLTWLVEADAKFAKVIDIGEKAFATTELEQAWRWIENE